VITNILRFCCATCPFIHKISKAYKTNVKIKKKEVDDVLGGEEAWANVDRTEAQCPACKHNVAYFLQIQIRLVLLFYFNNYYHYIFNILLNLYIDLPMNHQQHFIDVVNVQNNGMTNNINNNKIR